MDLTLQIEPAYQEAVDAGRIEAVVKRVLESQGEGGPVALSIVITGDEEIRALNRRFRGVDSPTDVLAFGVGEPDQQFVPPLDEPPYLGDVVISYPRAAAQAAERGHTTAEELDLLVIHGCLHLLGFEDETEAGREEMWRWQERLWRGKPRTTNETGS
jgi:probable rRNA maturation factor